MTMAATAETGDTKGKKSGNEGQAATPAAAAPPAATSAPSAPKGYANEGRPDIDGWVKPDEGVVVHGKIVGMIGFKDHQRDGTVKFREVVQIQLLEPLMARKKGGEAIELAPGKVVGLSMMFAVEPIRSYVANKGNVWLRFIRKESIGGGQSVWKVDLSCQGTKSQPVRIRPETVRAQAADGTPAEGDDDSIPF
jgi:hypothetical protein